MSLSAEQILKADDVGELEKCEVPEWGGDVYIKIMDGTSRDRWELSASKALEKPGSAVIRASLIAACACDESGKRLFSDGQIASLGTKSSIVLDRLFAIAKRINKLEDDDIEELEKN